MKKYQEGWQMNAAAISGDRAVKSQKKRKPGFFHEMHKNALLYALALPAIMYAVVFKYRESLKTQN
ncbi:MAG: hypothetical protein FWC60_00780 [Firmicutes bacterium]|nr:hypothetical protein [Bacillota bacterium]